jgi:hypothetical protein
MATTQLFFAELDCGINLRLPTPLRAVPPGSVAELACQKDPMRAAGGLPPTYRDHLILSVPLRSGLYLRTYWGKNGDARCWP